MYQSEHKHYDLPKFDRLYYMIPSHARLTKSGADHIYFHIPFAMQSVVGRYTVAITPLEVQSYNPRYPSTRFRAISRLSQKVKIPDIVLDPVRTEFMLLPDTSDLPTFKGRLVLGATYIIPDTPLRTDKIHTLQHHGMDFHTN